MTCGIESKKETSFERVWNERMREKLSMVCLKNYELACAEEVGSSGGVILPVFSEIGADQLSMDVMRIMRDT